MKLISIILLLFILSGCAILTGTTEEGAKFRTQYAIAKVIDGDVDKAAKVNRVVSDLRATIGDSPEATVSVLVDYVRGKIDFKGMEPADAILLSQVLNEAEQSLQMKIGDGVLDLEQRVKVKTFLGWVEAATNGYNSP
jgi:uncharacterized protein YceK